MDTAPAITAPQYGSDNPYYGTLILPPGVTAPALAHSIAQALGHDLSGFIRIKLHGLDTQAAVCSHCAMEAVLLHNTASGKALTVHCTGTELPGNGGWLAQAFSPKRATSSSPKQSTSPAKRTASPSPKPAKRTKQPKPDTAPQQKDVRAADPPCDYCGNGSTLSGTSCRKCAEARSLSEYQSHRTSTWAATKHLTGDRAGMQFYPRTIWHANKAYTFATILDGATTDAALAPQAHQAPRRYLSPCGTFTATQGVYMPKLALGQHYDPTAPVLLVYPCKCQTPCCILDIYEGLTHAQITALQVQAHAHAAIGPQRYIHALAYQRYATLLHYLILALAVRHRLGTLPRGTYRRRTTTAPTTRSPNPTQRSTKSTSTLTVHVEPSAYQRAIDLEREQTTATLAYIVSHSTTLTAHAALVHAAMQTYSLTNSTQPMPRQSLAR